MTDDRVSPFEPRESGRYFVSEACPARLRDAIEQMGVRVLVCESRAIERTIVGERISSDIAAAARVATVLACLALMACAGGCGGGSGTTSSYRSTRASYDPMSWSRQREADRAAREARELDRRVERLEREGRAVTRP